MASISKFFAQFSTNQNVFRRYVEYVVNYDIFSNKFGRFFRLVTQFSRTNRDEYVTSQQCHGLGKIIEPVKSDVRRTGRGGYIIINNLYKKDKILSEDIGLSTGAITATYN